MSKRFFLISQVFYPDEVSTAGLFTNLCSVLVSDNYKVVVWCAQPSYSIVKRQPRKKIHKGIEIHYLASTNFSKNSIIGKLINIITFSVSVFFRLLFSPDKDTVFTHTTPPPLGIIISWICALRRRRFVYILLDIFPEGLVRLGKLSANNLINKIWQKLFVISLIKSSRIIVLGRDMQSWLVKINSGLSGKVEYIPLWHDENISFYKNFESNEYIIRYCPGSKFVIQYSGNMGLWNDMETIGRSVNEVPEDVAFMFVGGGVRKKELMDAITPALMGRVCFLPFQPAEKLGMLLTACHVALISMQEGLEGMAVPCKIYGILASGIPVIAIVPETSEIASIVNEENCGLIVRPGDKAGLINAIEFLKTHDKLRIEMGFNGRKAFVQKYSTVKVAERYKSIISQLNN